MANKYLYIGISAAIILASTLGFVFFYGKDKNLKDPVFQAAYTTVQLNKHVDELGKNISIHTPAATQGRQYIHALENIKDDCRIISNIQSQDAGAVLKNTKALCEDLEPLVDYSLERYTAVLPLLKADTKVKRYQTFPFLENQLRKKHVSDVNNALGQLKASKTTDANFPSQSVKALEQLQAAIKNSQDLSHVKRIGVFQQQILAERQHYWTAYANIEALKREIATQVNQYCDVDQISDSLKECKT